MSLTFAPQFVYGAGPTGVAGTFVYGSQSVYITDWKTDLKIRSAVTPVPRSNISRSQDGYLGPRDVTIDAVIANPSWTTVDQFQAARDLLLATHAGGFGKLYLYSDRYLNAELRDYTEGPLSLATANQNIGLHFECADPFWYAASADAQDTWSTPATTNTRAVSNAGQVTCLPKFTFTFSSAAALALTFYNDTTGQSFTLTSTVNIANADVIVVDCSTQTVTLNGVNKMSYFGGSFFPLAVGSNTLRVVFTGPTIASIKTDKTMRYL